MSLESALLEIPENKRPSNTTVLLAREKVSYSRLTSTGLTEDEAAALVLYTMTEEPAEHSLYFRLNSELRLQDRKGLKPWRAFIWLMLHALKKLPPCEETVVHRACAGMSLADMGLTFGEKKTVTWSGFSSTAVRVEALKDFLEARSGGESRVILSIKLLGRSARDLSPFSMYPQESEVLLPPNVRVTMSSFLDAGNGLTIVQCTESQTLDPILPFGEHDVPLGLNNRRAVPKACVPMGLAVDTDSPPSSPRSVLGSLFGRGRTRDNVSPRNDRAAQTRAEAKALKAAKAAKAKADKDARERAADALAVASEAVSDTDALEAAIDVADAAGVASRRVRRARSELQRRREAEREALQALSRRLVSEYGVEQSAVEGLTMDALQMLLATRQRIKAEEEKRRRLVAEYHVPFARVEHMSGEALGALLSEKDHERAEQQRREAEARARADAARAQKTACNAAGGAAAGAAIAGPPGAAVGFLIGLFA